jgi:uncharacterized membrane protein
MDIIEFIFKDVVGWVGFLALYVALPILIIRSTYLYKKDKKQAQYEKREVKAQYKHDFTISMICVCIFILIIIALFVLFIRFVSLNN